MPLPVLQIVAILHCHTVSLLLGDAARPMNSTNAWEHLPVIKRGIKRVLFNFGSIDLMHLRMLDVATLAASQVANDLAIPICFSFAPDPHNLVQSLCF